MYIVITFTPGGGFDSAEIFGLYEDVKDAQKVADKLKLYFYDRVVEIREFNRSLSINDLSNFERECKHKTGDNLLEYMRSNNIG